MSKIYNKPPLNISQIVSKLQGKGLIVSDMAEAKQFLAHVGYYRLKAYIVPFENTQKKFLPNTDLKEIISLYYFDNDLKNLIAAIIEKIEISVRVSLVDTYSLTYGINWYEDTSLFKNTTKHGDILQKFDESINDSEEQFIEHYRSNYDVSKRPPAWMVFEILTFGALSRVFQELDTNQTKKIVSSKYYLPGPIVLQSWLRSFAYIRNITAHHARLWNKILRIEPLIPKKIKGKWIATDGINKAKLYYAISCMKYLLNTIFPNNTLKNDLETLFTKYPTIKISQMGFPSDWQQQPLWR